MTDVKYNVSTIIYPYQYTGKKDLGTLFGAEKIEWQNEAFFGYVDAVYKKAKICRLTDQAQLTTGESAVRPQEVSLITFATGMGFLLIKYLFENDEKDDDLELRAQENVVRGDGLLVALQELEKKAPGLKFFPNAGAQKAFVYNIIIGKIRDEKKCFATEGSSFTTSLDGLHKCYGSSNQFSLVTDMYYSYLGNEAGKELAFRQKYEDAVLMMLLLLKHERQSYLLYREKVVDSQGKRAGDVRKVKSKIIDLLTRYSFSAVSEDADIQRIYGGYRDLLMIAEYEEALSSLVFKLDDELGKKKDGAVTFVSVAIAVLGLFQLISVVLDIIQFCGGK